MNLFDKTNYEIIFIDTKYKVAIVGSPDKKYLWILAREKLDEKNFTRTFKNSQRKKF